MKVLKGLSTITFLFLFFVFAVPAQGARLHYEKVYQEVFCKQLGGVAEYALFDRTRVDCLTDEYAIEVDFADKWAEGVGQSLYYAEVTGRAPGILVIVESLDDVRYLKRILRLSTEYGIRIWTYSPKDID